MAQFLFDGGIKKMCKLLVFIVSLVLTFSTLGCSFKSNNTNSKANSKEIKIVFREGESTQAVNVEEKFVDNWWVYDSSVKTLYFMKISGESKNLSVYGKNYSYKKEKNDENTATYAYRIGGNSFGTVKYKVTNGKAIPLEVDAYSPYELIYDSGSDSLLAHYHGHKSMLFKREKNITNKYKADILYDMQLAAYDNEEKKGIKWVVFRNSDKNYLFPRDLDWNTKEK